MITSTNPVSIIDSTFPFIDNLFDDLIYIVFAKCILKDFVSFRKTCQRMDLLGKVHVARLIDSREIRIKSLLKTLPISQLNDFIGTSNLRCLSLKSFLHLKDSDVALIVRNFPRLKLLELANSKITQVSIKAISKLTWLESLSLVSCNKMNSLDYLTRLTKLKSLRVNSCRVKDLPSLDQWKFLEKIEISCVNLEIIPDFENFEYLQEISIKSCHKLKIPPTIGKLAALKLVKFHNCHSISWEATREWVRKVIKINPLCDFHYSKK